MSRYKHVTRDGVVYQAHRLIWEEANGPIPPGFDIHHKDNNPHNNALENLMCLSHADHLALHAKQRQEGTETEPTEIVLKDRQDLKDSYRTHRSKRIAHQKEYYEEHKDEIKEYRDKRRAEHGDEVRKQERAMYWKHRDAKRARAKVYREEHKEEIVVRRAKHYKENREEIIAWQHKYREQHKELIKEQHARYYREHIDKINAYRQAHKAEHTAAERVRRAIRKGKPQEEIDRLRKEYEALKAKQSS